MWVERHSLYIDVYKLVNKGSFTPDCISSPFMILMSGTTTHTICGFVIVFVAYSML